jgi:DNA (cytosine-5)-methyltransferase 1
MKQYKWKLSDGYPEKNGYKVFSCFACGGGSTMGYKRAGFDVIGMNEIDPKMADAYIANHNPKHAFIEPIQTFKDREDLPDELFDLDILDGSPPCSSFSMAGVRDRDWGKEKKFREGQAEQVLDTLFFDFIDLAKRLQPKIVLAENVKGMLLGDAKEYVREVYKQMDAAGYYVQHWLLNGADMGLPQRRERVFFVSMRKDLADPFLYFKDMFTQVPKLDLEFSERWVKYREFKTGEIGRPVTKGDLTLWKNSIPSDRDLGDVNKRVFNKESRFGVKFIDEDITPLTIVAGGDGVPVLRDQPNKIPYNEVSMISSFPLDYDYRENKPEYIMGMSVPPLMIQKIAEQIQIQWLDKL